MKTKNPGILILIIIAMIPVSSVLFAGSPAPVLKVEMISYKVGDSTYKAYIAYDQNIKGKRPVILVVHEWWGLNDYPKMRARKLAELGYFAVAVDLFGNGKVAANPKEAQELTKPFYKDPDLAKNRMEAAVQKIGEYQQADTTNLVAVGYCFGGGMVLDAAKLGGDYKAVVAFHPALPGMPPDKKLLTSKILVCYGESDKFVSMAAADKFKHQLDSIGADYTFKSYPNATHAFTNPASTETGKKFKMPIEYNPEADKKSWNDMRVFLAGVFKK